MRGEREGIETWLHDENVASAGPADFVLVRCWVDHHKQQLGYWPPPEDTERKLNEHERKWSGFIDDKLAH